MIVEKIDTVLRNEANCQLQEYDNEEDDVHGEIFGAATGLIEELARVCKDGFAEYFVVLADTLVKFTKDDRDEDDIATVIGVMGICMKHASALAPKYGIDILKVCFEVLEYGDEYINANVAFCVGMVIENAPDLIKEHAKGIMEKLKVMYENTTYGKGKDNALSTLARLAYSVPQVVPLDLIITAILKAIPLKDDPKENEVL
eukprot:CAMPEP_0114577296 /NCGR_PEP_ID=MMETSP0125-20121206/1975_1 /TAXON_ID=485358 ORGANISM="Aristerostoma sp., Strain ATCC 50986" /NCGR_SAMPLE_ID=MMETSP0125 /ASSEMBLY_ACC=CAM_ASM_000245 /LENGTH=201 /DNA_ID=CAMNT_0001766503 /DNA_START=2401 /DNA_END=3007 /DNA_ORIENTATION=-